MGIIGFILMLGGLAAIGFGFVGLIVSVFTLSSSVFFTSSAYIIGGLIAGTIGITILE